MFENLNRQIPPSTSSRTSEPTGRREAPPDDRLRERDPGPITRNGQIARRRDRSPILRYAWVVMGPFAGRTKVRHCRDSEIERSQLPRITKRERRHPPGVLVEDQAARDRRLGALAAVFALAKPALDAYRRAPVLL